MEVHAYTCTISLLVFFLITLNSSHGNQTEHKNYDDISVETMNNCNPKIKKCLNVLNRTNIQLKQEITRLKEEKGNLEIQMEYTTFVCAMNAIRRSAEFFYKEIVQKVYQHISDNAEYNDPIINRLVPPSMFHESQREYLDYKGLFRVIQNYTDTPTKMRQLPNYKVIKYLNVYLTTTKLRDEFTATIPSVHYLCRMYQNLTGSDGFGSPMKNQSMTPLSVVLSTDPRWSLNEVDLAYVNMLQGALGYQKIYSVTIKENPTYRDIIFPIADPKKGC